jgi:site-specific DNA-adenine methylase
MLDVLTPYIKSWGGRGRWIEPFLGSGVVSRYVRLLYPDVPMIVGDLNPWLMAAHKYWLSGSVRGPTSEDVSESSIERYRDYKDEDFGSLSERDQALRFMVCLYSAWGNRWQTKKDGMFATPINTARDGGDPEFLLRRLWGSYGKGWFNSGDLLVQGDWSTIAKQAEPGDLVFLDSPYPETAGYCVGWGLKDWSEMYCWADEVAQQGVHVLVCNPGTLSLLWRRVLQHSEEHFTPSQGRSTAPRTEYVGYYGPGDPKALANPVMAFFGPDSDIGP